ncbi:hypothetical protein WME99_40490 [Sorangium sp. So ce136]|uniref:hypothetical protein n=1 Tax=Sorangium sp. So ce136 TaxID=3133284 RepID=UPI003F0BDDF8
MKMTFNIETAPSFARRELAGVAVCAYASDALPDLGFQDDEARHLARVLDLGRAGFTEQELRPLSPPPRRHGEGRPPRGAPPEWRRRRVVVAGLARADLEAPAWLAVDKDARQVRVTSLPDETSIPFPIEVQLIIEYYSQRL